MWHLPVDRYQDWGESTLVSFSSSSNRMSLYLLNVYLYFHWACPTFVGYSVWTTGGCTDKNELGVFGNNATPETCKALCEDNSQCVSFELQKDSDDRVCSLSTSCVYADTAQSSSSNECFYESNNSNQRIWLKILSYSCSFISSCTI